MATKFQKGDKVFVPVSRIGLTNFPYAFRNTTVVDIIGRKV